MLNVPDHSSQSEWAGPQTTKLVVDLHYGFFPVPPGFNEIHIHATAFNEIHHSSHIKVIMSLQTLSNKKHLQVNHEV